MRAITHGYGSRPVVRDVSLVLPPGQLMCLLGPSGCGKTTTLRIAAGLEHPWTGEIRMGGETVAMGAEALPPERRHIGFLFQDFALFPHLTVADNVGFGITHRRRAERRQRVRAALDMVGMAEHAKVYPHTLSGGQQQRVALARALAPEPRLMLLDEPFSGLDARLRHQIRAETFDVLRANGVAAVMVTHDPEEAMYMADRIVLMDQGRIVQTGDPATLYHQPACPFAARFFGEINELPARVRHGVAETPLGTLPAPPRAGHRDAPRNALAMIRPEAFVLETAPQGDQPRARITAIRHLGRFHDVTLVIADGATGTHLHAHIADMPPIPLGAEVGIGLKPAGVFIFPADERGKAAVLSPEPGSVSSVHPAL
ncbi:ABC transporter ATP-binding protein [Roseospira marina]|uniref:ABC transporter ATP-binding protein n=2 Tax=Roseospira marina TaxID=140057 RepID=A0A5M6I7Y3_9PROT|nr:ABC transporter ATP-binding protein [Roseospira marina]